MMRGTVGRPQNDGRFPLSSPWPGMGPALALLNHKALCQVGHSHLTEEKTEAWGGLTTCFGQSQYQGFQRPRS